MIFKKPSRVSFISNCGPIPYEPKPAIDFIPQWFKNQKNYTSEESKTHAWLKDTIKQSFTPSIKKCIPMRESMTAGYIIPFPYDVAVKCMLDEYTGEPSVGIYAGVPKIGMIETIGRHEVNQFNEYPLTKTTDFDVVKVYKFGNPWIIKTPPKVSCTFQHPQYQGLDKWEVLSGVVDTDDYQNNILFPVFFKLNVGDEFIIRAGSPMVQVIPFVRESWEHNVKQFPTEKEMIEIEHSRHKINASIGGNRYKKWFWKNKVYK